MMQNVTIREQMAGAFRRAGYFVQGEPITLRQHILLEAYTELCREFDASAIALTPAADFDEIAHKMGYARLDPDKVHISREAAEGCFEMITAIRAADGRPIIITPDDTEPAIFAELTAALEVKQ